MTDRSSDARGFSLRRWSQRKHDARKSNLADAARRGTLQPAPATAAGATPTVVARSAPKLAVPAHDAGAPAPHARIEAKPDAASVIARVDPPSALPLPPVDSLGLDSDFTAFMQPGVDESLKRGALKKLFSDPRFNVMDGLDVYIDDYSKPDPLDPAIVRTLAQARYIFNPPPTRVTAEGYVEDIPEEELRDAAREAGSDPTTGQEPVEHDAAALPAGEERQDDAVPPPDTTARVAVAAPAEPEAAENAPPRTSNPAPEAP